MQDAALSFIAVKQNNALLVSLRSADATGPRHGRHPTLKPLDSQDSSSMYLTLQHYLDEAKAYPIVFHLLSNHARHSQYHAMQGCQSDTRDSRMVLLKAVRGRGTFLLSFAIHQPHLASPALIMVALEAEGSANETLKLTMILSFPKF